LKANFADFGYAFERWAFFSGSDCSLCVQYLDPSFAEPADTARVWGSYQVRTAIPRHLAQPTEMLYNTQV
jgi:hypothetical protein